jgi:endonuclease/exonuclease/phosphatase family metal-dependent hydrolase
MLQCLEWRKLLHKVFPRKGLALMRKNVNLENIAVIISALFFTIIFGCSIAFAQNSGEQGGAAGGGRRRITLKVMTINVRHNVDYWDERFPLIADEIVRLKPDLIGFQEMQVDINQSRTLLELIAKRAGPGGYNYEKYDRLKTGKEMFFGEGVSIFSRYPIDKKGYVDLENGRPGIFTRVKVADGLTVDFYNTHLHNKGGDEVRLEQARKLVEYEQKNDAGYPVFLTGDMNSDDGTQTIGYYIANSYIDTYRAVHGAETPVTGNTSSVILSKDNAQQNFDERIDYVFMKAPNGWEDRIKAVDSVVCFKNHDERGLYPSDHLGLMTTFEINY